MIEPLKVMTIVGTRPEIIRLSRVINKLENNLDHTLVHTGQNYNYELNEIFFKQLKISPPNYAFKIKNTNESASKLIGDIIRFSDEVIEKVKPDAVVILGDTNSSLSGIVAKRRKVPIFHLEAGNRCFDFRVPEEINRKIIDHIADVNLTYSSIAREYLLREGLPPNLVIKVGSPMYEVLDYYKADIENSDILNKMDLENRKYFLMSVHREENVDNEDTFFKITEIIRNIALNYDYPILISLHPRTEKKIKEKNIIFSKKVILNKPLGFFDYVKLQKNALVVLSDSGTISEEASILNLNALNLRETHERPEAMEEAAVMLTGLNYSNVLRGIKFLIDEKNTRVSKPKMVSDYKIRNVSDKVLKIILSYTDYVNKFIWHK